MSDVVAMNSGDKMAAVFMILCLLAILFWLRKDLTK